MLQTVDNYFSFDNSFTKDRYYFKFIGTKSQIRKDKKVVNTKLVIQLQDYLDKSVNNIFYSFFNYTVEQNSKNDLIISISKQSDQDKNDIFIVQSGNYVGKFFFNGLAIEIKSRFSNKFLERMLNFANDIFLDDVSVSGTESYNIDIFKFIIYYLFVQNLEKAFLLGLPKTYMNIKHHDIKLRGKIDINRFIKNDIPFKGKISSINREQKEIQEIIDVLYKAIKIINQTEFNIKNISHVKTHLKQHKSNKYVSTRTILRAIQSKSMQNPIFFPYKKVLEYAKYIIVGNSIEEKLNGKNETYGFVINVAELFEIYITKLLQKEFPNWRVESPSIWLENDFGKSYLYQRRIIPDIVMVHNNEYDVMVFDTKYKRMKFQANIYGSGSDIDRSDFFQINTYMNYYNNQDKYNLIAGGLLYPIEQEFDCRFNNENCIESDDYQKAHSHNWFGNNKVKFIVDGIDLFGINDDSKISDIKTREDAFIKRIKKLMENTE